MVDDQRSSRRMADPNEDTGFTHADALRVTTDGRSGSAAGISLLVSGINSTVLALHRGWRRWRDRD